MVKSNEKKIKKTAATKAKTGKAATKKQTTKTVTAKNRKQTLTVVDSDTGARSGSRVQTKFIIDYAIPGKDKKTNSPVKGDGDYFFDFASNISIGGVFIRTSQPSKVDTNLDVRFFVPGTKNRVSVKAVVMWVQENNPLTETTPGMGVQFIDLSDENRKTIQKFIGITPEISQKTVI